MIEPLLPTEMQNRPHRGGRALFRIKTLQQTRAFPGFSKGEGNEAVTFDLPLTRNDPEPVPRQPDARIHARIGQYY